MLYPRLLQEAARVAMPQVRFVLITHERQLLEASLQNTVHLWQLRQRLDLAYKNLRPRIYLLERTMTFD
jgi:ubiquinone/menaquinone biosynthesis C-methylase UbiE